MQNTDLLANISDGVQHLSSKRITASEMTIKDGKVETIISGRFNEFIICSHLEAILVKPIVWNICFKRSIFILTLLRSKIPSLF